MLQLAMLKYQLLGLIVLVGLTAALERTPPSCNSSCQLHGRARFPNRCLLGDVCPMRRAQTSDNDLIVAEFGSKTILYGCTDSLEKKVVHGPRFEVHAMWVSWLPNARGSSEMVLELQNFSDAPLDRPVVLAFLGNGGRDDRTIIRLDLRALELFPYDVTIYVSPGIVVCGVDKERIRLIPSKMNDEQDALRWTWKTFGVVHTFVARGFHEIGESQENISYTRHFVMNIGHGKSLRDESSVPQSCATLISLVTGDQPLAPIDRFMSTSRLKPIRSLLPPTTLATCALDRQLVRACPQYRVRLTPRRNLFILEVSEPYDADAHTQLSTFVSDVNNNIEVDISIMPIEEGIHIVNRRVTVVLINRSDKAISWNVDCHGLGKNSMLAIVTGGLSSVKRIRGVSTDQQEPVTFLSRDQRLATGHTLIDTLQRHYGTTITAYAATVKATVFKFHLPIDGSGVKVASNRSCVRTDQIPSVGANFSACRGQVASVRNSLSHTILTQCSSDLFTVRVDMTGLEAGGWQVDDLDIFLGHSEDCRLRAVGADAGVRVITVARDRCGVTRNATWKGTFVAEIIIRHTVCRYEDGCKRIIPKCRPIAGAVVQIPISCYSVSRRRSLVAYQDAKRLLPHLPWIESSKGKSLYFELGNLAAAKYNGRVLYPLHCSLESEMASLPVLRNGCLLGNASDHRKPAVDGTHAIVSPEQGVFWFSVDTPDRSTIGATAVLQCLMTACKLHDPYFGPPLNIPMCKDMEMMCSRFAGGHSHALVPSISLSAGIIYISPESSQPPPAVPCSAIPAGPPTTQEVATVEEKEKKDDDDDDDNEDDEPVVAGNTIRTGVSTMVVVGISVSTFFLGSLLTLLAARCMSVHTQHVTEANPRKRPPSQSNSSSLESEEGRRRNLDMYVEHPSLSLGSPMSPRTPSRQLNKIGRSVSMETGVSGTAGHRSLSVVTTSTMLPASTCNEGSSN